MLLNAVSSSNYNHAKSEANQFKRDPRLEVTEEIQNEQTKLIEKRGSLTGGWVEKEGTTEPREIIVPEGSTNRRYTSLRR